MYLTERESRNKCIEEKREQCVCVLECVLECVWVCVCAQVCVQRVEGPHREDISASISVLAPDIYGSTLPQLHSPPTSFRPFSCPPPHLTYSSTEQVSVCSRSANVWSLCSDWLKKPSNGYTFGRRNKNSTGCVLRWCHFIVFLQGVNVHVSWGGAV